VPDGARAVTPNTPRLLLLAPPSSYRTGPYLRAAERLGVEAVLASTGKHPLVSGSGGLNLSLPDLDDSLRTILEVADNGPGFSAVVATDDLTVDLAGLVAHELGLPGNDPGAARISRRKDRRPPVSMRHQAARAVRKPRGDPRR
jgi:hypothetical protein